MRHQERTGAGIEETARETRQRLGAGLVARRGVAGRQDHQVGIELKLRHRATSLAVSKPSSTLLVRRLGQPGGITVGGDVLVLRHRRGE
jgi:hypothetical protein